MVRLPSYFLVIYNTESVKGDKFRYLPKGIVFNSPKAYTDIYNLKANVKKCKTYEAWKRNAQDSNTLSETSVPMHAQKRKLLNLVFTEKSVRSAGEFINKHVDRWNELLLDGAGEEWSVPRNLTDWSDSLVFDILGDLCFGRSFEIKEPKENPLKVIPHTIVGYMRFYYPITKSPLLDLVVWLKPRGLDKLFEALTPPDVKRYFRFIEGSVSERRQLEVELQTLKGKGEAVREDMFHYLFQAKNPETGEPAYSEQELLAEANLLIIAGSDTTSINLCGFVFYITRNPRIYAKLIDEIRSTFESADEIVGGQKLLSCEYLRACIHESMRMTPAGPSELGRTVLAGGMTIDNEFVPEGIEVGCAGWSTGRNEETYGDPHTYRPERWIVDEAAGNSAEEVARIRSCFHPFSAGPGSCVGKNLAILELMTTIGRTLHRMDVRQAPGQSLGEGSPQLGWGRRNRRHFQMIDAYIAIREGPVVQFKRRKV
ncbi:hypothetical protein MMC27_008324 [Xylographa pallens]|nr:hypothetical protein [Xylographa pallens]